MMRLLPGLDRVGKLAAGALLLGACGGQSPNVGDSSGVRSTQATTTSVSPTASPQTAACPISTAELRTALGAAIPSGIPSIDADYTGDNPSGYGSICTFTLPAGTFALDGSTDAKQLLIETVPYRANVEKNVGVFDVERNYGGSTPAAVYESSYVAIRDTDAATSYGQPTQQYPGIGGGLVCDGLGTVVLAGTGDSWFEIRIQYGKGDPSYADPLVSVGRAIASNG